MRRLTTRLTAWTLSTVLCAATVLSPAGYSQAAQKKQGAAAELLNPVIEAEEGKVIWDCIYFGNYWQSNYTPQEENQPQEDGADAVYTDTDGTRYLMRADESCYRWEPVKWRVLSVNADGTDALLLADQNVDIQPYHQERSETVTWETSFIRGWLNDTFLNTVFTQEEQGAIRTTEIANEKNNYYVEENGQLQDAEPSTWDKIYLPSVDEMMTRAYGFTDDLEQTETRTAKNTDFTNSGGTARSEDIFDSYRLRTMGTGEGLTSGADGTYGDIPAGPTFQSSVDATDKSIRPMLHVDLTKTESWAYAGRIKQDQTVPGEVTATPTPAATKEPQVTMAPAQLYPKNPTVYKTDLTKNTWDCIYFGKYYQTKLTPSVLSPAAGHNQLTEDEKGNPYLIRHEEGYFSYEPVKWRVLSINEDGTDAFLMADKVLAVQPYAADDSKEITWDKSDIRQWLNYDFAEVAFTEAEKEAIRETEVSTEANPWSGLSGGTTVTDKVYLPSIEEMTTAAYGFGTDSGEADTRKMKVTDFVTVEGTKSWTSYSDVYWMRSAGSEKGHPAYIGEWDEGVIPAQTTANSCKSALGVRPVLHVDLSDRSVWSYAGKVTPKGIVLPQENTSLQKPAKPQIKQVKNKKGRKAVVTLAGKVSGASGYEVAYAKSASMKGQKIKKLTGTKVTLSGLKKKKTYYFKARAYTTKDGKTVYSGWSKKKSIKIKK